MDNNHTFLNHHFLFTFLLVLKGVVFTTRKLSLKITKLQNTFILISFKNCFSLIFISKLNNFGLINMMNLAIKINEIVFLM